MKKFKEAWFGLFIDHQVELIIVEDGKMPTVYDGWKLDKISSAQMVMGQYSECLTNLNAGIRNLGFAYVARYLPEVEYIITLDDDEVPIGDPIQDHIDALNKRVPISWLSTAVDDYTRGFPYGVREEAEVVLSHGVWEGVADWDAPTQLVKGSHQPIEFYRGAIPKGIYYPMCSMNLAFKRKMLPYIFHAPWALGINRFDDIFTGITSKRVIDKKGWAAVTGYARVHHERASNTFTNLKHEAPGIELLETFWKGDESHPYFKIYKEKLKTWQKFIKTT
jgi:reversibly glycosylated polypeptide/UDP-arabinopyranose mutase